MQIDKTPTANINAMPEGLAQCVAVARVKTWEW